jgi:hypothetical protein
MPVAVVGSPPGVGYDRRSDMAKLAGCNDHLLTEAAYGPARAIVDW